MAASVNWSVLGSGKFLQEKHADHYVADLNPSCRAIEHSLQSKAWPIQAKVQVVEVVW